MTNTEQSQPRLLTTGELAAVIRFYRELRQWSQEQLAGLSGISTRTIQRIERGEASGFDTRRAIALAFEFDDIDALNKPFAIPTDGELRAAREKFEREHITLKALPFEMPREADKEFAALVDYMREYRSRHEKRSDWHHQRVQ